MPGVKREMEDITSDFDSDMDDTSPSPAKKAKTTGKKTKATKTAKTSKKSTSSSGAITKKEFEALKKELQNAQEDIAQLKAAQQNNSDRLTNLEPTQLEID